MKHVQLLALVVVLSACATRVTADDGDAPIVVTPHPQAGKFRLQHDPDRPLLGFYGGVGLRKLEDGRWTGYGQTSPKDVEYLIRRCVENGIKRIYGSFQEEAYPSAIAPAASGKSEIDYVALCIKLAHESNIQVYADQPCFAFVKERNAAFAEANPHFFTRSVTGEHDTHMLSAAYPEVRRFKRSMFMEFVKNYPIDGLQLDFIRFPYYTMDLRVGYGKHGYDEPALRAFRTLYGYGDGYQPRPDDPRWVRMKTDLVSQFIRELRADLKASGIDLPIGVYNSGHYGRGDSYRTVHQDWRTWEEQRLVDEHSPMFYLSSGLSNLARAVQSLADVKRPEGRIIGPIFLSEGFEPGEAPSAALVRDAARRLIKLGCDELWFCRASEIEQFDLWPVVKEISQWSIREIRAESFDPLYENLLTNGEFVHGLKSWTIDRAGAAVKAGDDVSLRVTAVEQPVGLSQAIAVRPVAHMPVDTLSFAATMRAAPGSRTAAAAPAVAVHLTYLNGTRETVSEQLGDLDDAWKTKQFTVKARTDFARLVLTKAEFVMTFAAGTSVEIDRVEVQRDLCLDRDAIVPAAQ